MPLVYPYRRESRFAAKLRVARTVALIIGCVVIALAHAAWGWLTEKKEATWPASP